MDILNIFLAFVLLAVTAAGAYRAHQKGNIDALWGWGVFAVYVAFDAAILSLKALAGA